MNLFFSPAHEMNSRRPRRGVRLLLSIFVQEFFHLVTLNALFVIFSLPVLTLPAAYAAMTRVTGYYAQELPCRQWKEFIRVFRSELLRALPVGLPLLLLPAALCLIGVQYIPSIWSAGSYLIVSLTLAGAALLLMMRYYFFPQLVWSQASIGQALKNSFLFAIVRLFPNLLLLLLHAVLAGIVVYYFPMSSPYLALCVFASINLFSTFLALSGMRRFMLESSSEGTPAEDETTEADPATL